MLPSARAGPGTYSSTTRSISTEASGLPLSGHCQEGIGPGGAARPPPAMYPGRPCSSTGVSVRVTCCVSAFDHLADPPASITQNRTLPSGPPSRPVTAVNSTVTGPTANCSPGSRVACAAFSSVRNAVTNSAIGIRPSPSPTAHPLRRPHPDTALYRPEGHRKRASPTRRASVDLPFSRRSANLLTRRVERYLGLLGSRCGRAEPTPPRRLDLLSPPTLHQ